VVFKSTLHGRRLKCNWRAKIITARKGEEEKEEEIRKKGSKY
jgi:hypothetical protein